MILSILLVVLGLLFVYTEFFLPGAIMAILGGFAIFAGIVLFTFWAESALDVVLFVGVVAVALVLVIRFALQRVTKSHSVYLDRDQGGWYASGLSREMVGKEGVAATDLRPGGFVIIDKKRYQAISRSGYTQKGEPITVIAVEEESLIVKGKG